MIHYFAILIFLTVFYNGFSQNISAFSDYRNYFYVFENGSKKLLEPTPVKEYKTGGNCVVYFDNAGNFKVYHNGVSYQLLDIAPQQYFVTDNIVAFTRNNILTIFDKGETKTLSNYTTNFLVSDSIVSFFDDGTAMLRAYQNGIISDLEIGRISEPISVSDMKIGSNILAYINLSGHLKIFYNGKLLLQEAIQPESHSAANNIVAYVDGYSQSFKVFHSGTTYTLENIPPKSYQTANDMVAYVDNSGSFKIFYNGETQEIFGFEPQFYTAEKNMIFYFDNNNFNVFYNGKITTIERFIPDSYQINFSSLAYIDRSGYLKFFYEGKLNEISRDNINSFELSRNVLLFRTGINDVHFFSEGKAY